MSHHEDLARGPSSATGLFATLSVFLYGRGTGAPSASATGAPSQRPLLTALTVLATILGALAFAAAPALAAAPEVEGSSVSEVASTSATFSATVNPEGAPTSYTFEYAPAGGSFTPVLEAGGSGSLAEGTSGVPLSVHVTQGLNPSTAYEVRLTASNSVKNVTGEPVSFTTQGAGGGSALLDGRQWEMVSPPQKHGALIFPLDQELETDIQAAADGDVLTYETSAPTEANPQGYSLKEQVLSSRGSAGWESQDISAPHSEPSGLRSESEYSFFSSDLSHGILQPLGSFEPALSVEGSEQTAYLRTDYLNNDVNDRCAGSCYRPLVTGKPGYANVPPGTAFAKYLNEHEFPCNPYQSCGPQFVSATPDLSHVALHSEVPLTSGPPVEAGGVSPQYLYEWSAGKLAPIGVLPDGELSGSADLGGSQTRNVRHAISDDGSRVVWYVFEGKERGLYLRDTARGDTVRIAPAGSEAFSTSNPVFQTASNDGSRIFFSSPLPLTPDSGKVGTHDLYECEMVEAPGGLQCKLSDLTPPSPSGESANVQGLVLGASEDGSYVYFVANGVLAPGAAPGSCTEGNATTGATCNLYVNHNGSTKLVAVVSNEDFHDWAAQAVDTSPAVLTARVSPDGRWLAFMSQRELTGYDNRDASSGERDQEVYLYDTEAGHLVCASCNPTGARPVGAVDKSGLIDREGIWQQKWLAANIPTWTTVGLIAGFTGHSVYQPRFLSDSGRLFFNSNDALVPQDVNGTWDVYEYEPEGVPEGKHACTSSAHSGSDVFKPAHSFDVEGSKGEEGAGCVGLISSGTSAEESAFLDASETGGEGAHGEELNEGGGDVFFLTEAKLAPQDIDTALDIYDAHECTSASPCVAPPAAQPPPCVTEASCKAAPTPQPGLFGAPPSATFSGPGNVAPPPPAKAVLKRAAHTRAGKLAKALRACRKKPKGKKRASCEQRARKSYGPAKTTKKAKKSSYDRRAK